MSQKETIRRLREENETLRNVLRVTRKGNVASGDKNAATRFPALAFEVPGLRLVSEMNYHEHWRVRHQRKKAQQAAMLFAIHQHIRPGRVELPARVTITRIGARRLDSDNLAGAAKNCQDSIARALGVDDGNELLIEWHYKQEVVGRRYYAVRVEIEAL